MNRRILSRAALLLVSVLSIAVVSALSQSNSRSAKVKPAQDRGMTIARWNNLGVAYMDQQKPGEAAQAFEKAHALDPQAVIPELNRGIAMLNQQKIDDAREILTRLAKRAPQNPRVWYNLGLLYRNSGQTDQALQAFTKTAELAPEDADTHYFLGDLNSQLQKYPQAISFYQRCLATNPFHISAEFGLARAYQREGNVDKAREHLARFQQLTREKLGAPISLVYGEQGAYSLVQRIETEPQVPAAIAVRFAEAGSESGLPTKHLTPTRSVGPAAYLGSGVCVFDYDGDGLPDIFLPGGTGKSPELFKNQGAGRYQDVTRVAGLDASEPGIGCSAGDYDNDGMPDLAVSYPNHVALYHNNHGKFRDVTQAAGIRVDGAPVGILFVDYDHDGDLDLYVARFSQFDAEGDEIKLKSEPSGNMLWRNNGNGSFTNVTDSTGLAGNFASLGAIASDLNNDRAVDFLVANWQGAPVIYSNPREGRFVVSQPWSSIAPGATVGATVLDFNKDGWMDVAFTHAQAPGLTLWRNMNGRKFEAAPLPSVNWKRAWGVAALDYDNDGWIDIAAIGETATGSELRLFRNLGPRGFQDVTESVGLGKVRLQNPRALVAFDYDGDGAADLLVTQLDGSVVLLRNTGGSQNHSLRVALKGLADNKSGLGVKVEVFAGDQRQKWETAGSSGYLSQGPVEVLAGLGQQNQADVVRLLWPTGVVQDEIQLGAGKTHSIGEIDRRGSSCPVLFVWNGERYELITDVIGPAVIGHWIGPDERDIPDPDEYVKVDGARAKLLNGHLSFRFAEPMEEVNYLDQVRLVAIDHPRDTDVFPNERFVSNPPFPEFKVIASRGAHPPAGAWDDSGKSVLPALLYRDHKYVSGFPLLKFAGFAKPHILELDLGEWQAARPLRLLMHGFTEYFSANSMYAAYQSAEQVTAPYLEAFGPDGKWSRVIDDLGFPAGLPRTMVGDLTGHLAPGTRRIRIVTNLQIYWDQILVDNSPDNLPVHVSEAPLATAELHFHGYPKSVEKYFSGDLDYIYEQASLTGPFARHAGTYTRYGDVLPLLKNADDRFVIFGSGEEVMLDFDAGHLPALPRGWSRDYFFYANGFVKDMDFYEADALTVHPLPFHTMKRYPYPETEHFPDDRDSIEYQLEYNTRYQSGNGVTTYRFAFSPE